MDEKPVEKDVEQDIEIGLCANPSGASTQCPYALPHSRPSLKSLFEFNALKSYCGFQPRLGDVV